MYDVEISNNMSSHKAWQVLSTPSDRFDGIVEYPYNEHWVNTLPGYEGIKIHYVDEGPADVHVFLCLHGEPSWSFLYRKMINVFTTAGYRTVCPDLIGFGKSDKILQDEAYTPEFHRNMLIAFVKHLKLKNVTLVCQDWGGILGLTLPIDLPQLVSSAIIMNTTFATGEKPSDGFLFWKAFCKANPDLPVGDLFRKTNVDITDDIAHAYNAPFPSAEYKAGVRRFPQLVPLEEDGTHETPFAKVSQRAEIWWKRFKGPVFVAVGTEDIVFGEPVMRKLHSMMRNSTELMLVKDGHFVQEKGDCIATAALTFFHKQPAKL